MVVAAVCRDRVFEPAKSRREAVLRLERMAQRLAATSDCSWLLLETGGDNHHGARRFFEYAAGRAADEEFIHGTMPMGAHDDIAGVEFLRFGNNSLDRRPEALSHASGDSVPLQRPLPTSE